MGYVLCATWGITFVKRIKSKTLLKTSIIVIMIKFILKQISRFFKWIKKVIKNAYSKIKGKIPLYLKVIGGMIGYCFIVVILTMLFGPVGLIFAGIIAFVLIYPLIVNINCFSKVEKHLEKMYKGEYAEKLKSEEFTSDFQNTVTYINDISSGFEKAIDENVKSERLKTELITNVSHDIKTPLTSIINYVDLLKKEDIENEKVKEYLDILENKSQRLKKLTEDLVEASKASSGNVKLNLEKINICELIRQATGEFEDKFGEKKLEIISSFPDQDLYINADNRYLYRVIENLYSNISKYTLESSRVYIDIKRIENNVNVTMKNISKEKLNISAEELAQRFVRGDKSRSTEGSGLGISISKSLTELQNGKFSLQIDGDLFKVELEFAII
jgi:signal transduction histidine kinase